MYPGSYSNKKRYSKNNRILFGGQHLLLESDKTEYSGFAMVLFNKQMSNLIHCPVTAKGSYSIPDTVVSIDSYVGNLFLCHMGHKDCSFQYLRYKRYHYQDLYPAENMIAYKSILIRCNLRTYDIPYLLPIQV